MVVIKDKIKFCGLLVLLFALFGCAGKHVSLTTEPAKNMAKLSFDQEGFTEILTAMNKQFGSFRKIENETGEIVFKRNFFNDMAQRRVVSLDLEGGRYVIYSECQTKKAQGPHTIRKVAQWINLKAGEETQLGCAWYKTGRILTQKLFLDDEQRIEEQGIRLQELWRKPIGAAGDKSFLPNPKDKAGWQQTEQELSKNFFQWLKNRKNTTDQNIHNFYAPNYRDMQGRSLQRWKAERDQPDAAKNDIRIGIGYLKIVPGAKANQAEISYPEHYTSPDYEDRKLRFLALEKLDGKWKITQELVANLE